MLLLAVLAVFGQTAGHDFVNFDDNDYVYENRHVREGLSAAGIAWAFTETHVQAHWHPLTWLSLMADAQALRCAHGHLDLARLAAEMHLVNLALHAANALLLFMLLRAMTANLWPSALVAAFIAVHPAHVESVAWITERKDVLSGLFGLLALCAYAWYARGPSLPRYLSVAVALALGLMCKPVLVTWPFLFLMLDYWPLGRLGARSGEPRAGQRGERGERENLPFAASPFLPFSPASAWLLVEKIPLLLLAAASATVTFLAQQSTGTVLSLTAVPIFHRIARAAVLYVTYLAKTIWPVNLAVMYSDAPLESYWPALGAGVLLALVSAGAVWGARRGQRWLAVGWFWYLVAMVPTIGLVQVGLQVTADRFLYLPQIGLCIAIVWGVRSLTFHPFSLSPSLPFSSALLLACLMACAWQQTSYWRDSQSLWTRTLAFTPRNPTAHDNLGTVLADRGQIDAAIAHFRKALEINPGDELAHIDLANVLAGAPGTPGRGHVDEAMAHYRMALKIRPDSPVGHYNFADALCARGQVDEAKYHYRMALEIKPDFEQAHNKLGLALAGRGQVEAAIAQFRQALAINPDLAEGHYNLALTLARQGQIDEAMAHYRTALEINRDYAEAHNNYAATLAGRGEYAAAIAHYQKALAIKPDYALAHINFGAALVGCGRVDEAIAHYRQALEIKPDFTAAHYNLADALAGRGLSDEARAHFQKALDLATAQNDRALAEAIRDRIRLLPKTN